MSVVLSTVKLSFEYESPVDDGKVVKEGKSK